jgi:hypothetical protein
MVTRAHATLVVLLILRIRRSLFKALRKNRFPADGALSLECEANPDNPLGDIKA